MDALKTKRKSLRTSFTTTANKLKECLAKKEDAKDGDELRAVKSQLQDKFLRLDEIQNKISSLLLENNETAAEYESDFQAAEDYRDNFLELKSQIETLLNKDFGYFLESPPELDVVGHLAKRCHSSVRCLICKRRHYPLLCPDLRKGKESNFSPKDRTADNEQRSTETLLTNLPSEHEIYLKTIMIRLRNRDKEVCARALLDDGSQRSYIEKNLAAELFLSPSGREIFSQGLFGGGISPASEHKRYMVNVESLNRKYSTPLSLLEQQKICSTLPRIHDRKLLSELSSRGIKLTDVGRDSPPIRVLLGADILGSILTGRIEEDQDKQMVLGLSWDVISDELSCKLPSNIDCTQGKPVTKRVLLSVINSVYDPIGFTAPALLLPKLLMQEAWRGKIGWDEVLPVELEHKYRLWERTMHFMSKCAISRRLFAENYDDFTVHIFTDASAYAYAACAFLRCEFKGQVTVKLMAAKARLAPMKKSTIPRLELLGATLGARLAETVDSILRTTSKTYFWCDSMVVLSWIKKKEPWYGGFWERMVRSIKELLRKCLGKACVTYEEMLTLLSDCEATINGRPLTYLSDDPKELKPLTPAHFIQDIKERETFDLDLIDSQHMLKRVRYLHTLRSNLRERFYKEYLGELVRSPKVASRRKIISPGEIVIVESKNPNRMNWPLAQVIELFPGKDGVERVAKLRLASGEIIRPLQRIYPLELSASDHLIEDHHGTDIAAQNPGPTATDVLKEGKKSRWGRPLIPVKRLNL
ncbi:integrase catalytic domain-containing protein [Trichonephila clavata]|uniref:Integrase catalytic domain-containing protein n=1 Tax=Trichonephila clavata TaxID=2740835 RepID=A0A8X6FCW4_TRICU|nr:integrase catalytic domain-containing protein [Trichonephila clavata]